MTSAPTTIDLASYRPAAVFLIDLVGHSKRPKSEVRRIQAIVEETFASAAEKLAIPEVVYNYTGDGYVCAFLGDSSSRFLDFVNVAIPQLRSRLARFKQAFRGGADFGLLYLRENALTNMPEHFNKPGIQAARLGHAADPDQILCTASVFEVFAPHYPNLFPVEPRSVTTKDRDIVAYEIHPVDFVHVQKALLQYLLPSRRTEDNTPEPVGTRNRIMVVDDEYAIAKYLSKMLADEFPGFAITTVNNFAEARSAFEPGAFAVVITDWRIGA